MYITQSIYLISVLIITVLASYKEVPGYYWREYTGVIPYDAIPGGTDRSGRRTYIGQLYSAVHGLLPAVITQGSKIASAYAGGILISSEEDVKILCSTDSDRLRWIPTRSDETHLLTNCHFVNGGKEAGYVIYIGRANHEMETLTGKAFGKHTKWPGVWVYKNGPVNYLTYEVLTYDCDLSQYVGNASCIAVY